MSSGYTQTGHLISITTSLGTDVLLLTGFSGQEGISRLFAFELSMLSDNTAIAATDIVGTNVTVTINDTGQVRYFNGIISRFRAGGMANDTLRQYTAEMVPWLWLLTKTTDCKIFQNQTAPDIISAVFSALGFSSSCSQSLSGTYSTREYCVQYRETAFDFVSRLMEEEGIFYFFTHTSSAHTLVMADQASAYQACVESSVPFFAGTMTQNHISVWEHGYSFISGKMTRTDYNFETPSSSLLTSSSSVVTLSGISAYEQYDYPGRFDTSSDATPLVDARMGAEEVGYESAQGASDCPTFMPGGTFTLSDHVCSSEANLSYVFTSVSHSMSDGSYLNAGGGNNYSNTFECIPSTVVFRPARVTPRPFVHGPQTAVVVGPSGEEIYVDKYGRIKVQFFWDRVGTNDENSSCYLRVSQLWAGANWGIMFHPRIGQEVIVSFLEGDPDRPLVTGRVYNANEMPPYTLPDNMTQSTIKSRSTTGGGTDNFNEIFFEDKSGSEQILIHAERDFNRIVENNDTLSVGFTTKSNGDQTIDIYNNQTITIEQGSRLLTVKTGNESVVVSQGDRSVEVDQGNDTHTIKTGNRVVEIDTGNDTLTVKTGNRTVEVDTGNDTHTIKTGNRAVEIDVGNDTLTIKLGNQTTTLNVGKSSTSALQGIELTCGANSIKIDPSGITIQGVMVTVQGTGSTQISGAQTQISGSGMLQLQGGILMIN